MSSLLPQVKWMVNQGYNEKVFVTIGTSVNIYLLSILLCFFFPFRIPCRVVNQLRKSGGRRRKSHERNFSPSSYEL